MSNTKDRLTGRNREPDVKGYLHVRKSLVIQELTEICKQLGHPMEWRNKKERQRVKKAREAILDRSQEIAIRAVQQTFSIKPEDMIDEDKKAEYGRIINACEKAVTDALTQALGVE